MATYRSGAEFIRPEQYAVEKIERTVAKAFVIRHPLPYPKALDQVVPLAA